MIHIKKNPVAGGTSFYFMCLLVSWIAFLLTALPASAKNRTDIRSPFACSGGQITEHLSRQARANPKSPPRFGSEPVSVDIGLYVEQLTNVSEVNNSFQVNAYVETIWCDPRLAFRADQLGYDQKLLIERDAVRRLEEIWWPDLMLIHASDTVSKTNQELMIFSDGTVVYEEIVAANIRTRLNLVKFPFDAHHFEIALESFAHPAKELLLHLRRDKVGFSNTLNMPSWRLTHHQATVLNVKEIRDRDSFSEALLRIHAERVWQPTMYRLALPLMMIIVVSWSVFWLRPMSTGRFGVTFTTILTVVAFNFTVSQKLPNVPEITYLEALYGFSLLLLVLVVVENTSVDRLTALGNSRAAEHLDRFSRWFFPVIYLLGVIAVTYLFGIVSL